jgi:hypothetical protein
MFKIIPKILNSIFNYNKDKQDTNKKEDTIKKPTEVEISEQFEKYFLENFDYEYCKKIIEDYDYFNLNSNILNQFIRMENFENEFQFKKFVFQHIGEPELNKKIVFFEFYRRISKNIYENISLIGYFVFNTKNVICFANFNEKFFNHYYFNGEIPLENNLNMNIEYNRQQVKKNIKINNSKYYFYNFNENKIGHIIYLPVTQLGLTELRLRDSDKESFFSYHKVYSIEIEIDINSNNFCSKSKANLYYGEELLREFEFELYDDTDFMNAIEKLLFPFILPNDKKIELGFENVTLDQIKNNFDNEFKLYKIVNL